MKNTKTLRIMGTNCRVIPGFPAYAISAFGELFNTNTKNSISPKDYDHRSGRYTLYNARTKKFRTFNTMQLLRMTYTNNWVRSIENQLV